MNSKASRASQRQDERAAPAVDSPVCPCWWVIKGRQQGVLPPHTIIQKGGISMTEIEAYQEYQVQAQRLL